jgi:ribosomal protein S27AE
MKRKAIRGHPDLDTLARDPPLADPPEVRLALARRRCPRCGGFIWREPGRLSCSQCYWEYYV